MQKVALSASCLTVYENVCFVKVVYDDAYFSGVSAGDFHADVSCVHFFSSCKAGRYRVLRDECDYAAIALAFATSVFRVQALQSLPPYGLSGLRVLRGSAFTCAFVPLATPGRTAPQSAHCGAAFLRRLYCITLSAPGVLTYIRLNVRERYFGATMACLGKGGVYKGFEWGPRNLEVSDVISRSVRSLNSPVLSVPRDSVATLRRVSFLT